MKKIDYTKLLKDVDMNPYPDCPRHLVRRSGTEGMICDREGFQYIVADPLLKAIEYLYDINVRTESCGQNDLDEMGISIDYGALDERNKRIVDEYLRKKKDSLIEPNAHHSSVRFRISVPVDIDKDTVADAESRIIKEVYDLGLVKQDVLYGRDTKADAIKYMMEAYSTRTLRWTDDGYQIINTPTITETEALDIICENGGVVDEDEVWYSRELHRKHTEYIKEL